jgi:hypothetical protein
MTLFDPFADFLLANRLIEPQILARAVEIQLDRTPRIGQLAVELKILNIKQVFEILRQQEASENLFGQVATRLGYMDSDQVQELVDFQNKLRPALSDILVECKAMTLLEVEAVMIAFKQTAAPQLPNLSYAPAAISPVMKF